MTHFPDWGLFLSRGVLGADGVIEGRMKGANDRGRGIWAWVGAGEENLGLRGSHQ